MMANLWTLGGKLHIPPLDIQHLVLSKPRQSQNRQDVRNMHWRKYES
jgi:hypothetical protein